MSISTRTASRTLAGLLHLEAVAQTVQEAQ